MYPEILLFRLIVPEHFIFCGFYYILHLNYFENNITHASGLFVSTLKIFHKKFAIFWQISPQQDFLQDSLQRATIRAWYSLYTAVSDGKASIKIFCKVS